MTTFNLDTIANLFNNAVEKHVNLSQIIMDAGTQQRASMDKQAIENYMEAMQAGQAPEFPPVKLVELTEPVTLPDGTELEIGATVLADGFHRIESAVGAKLGTFQSLVAKGTLQDAIYYSMTANSQNGVNLKGKDYQQAIKKLYTMDGGYWRQHGRKQEIAALFGCSTKTVERATQAIDKATKAEAFKMFEQGASIDEVAAMAHKSEKTVKQWFDEWKEIQDKNNEPKGDQDGTEGTNQEQHTNAGDNNPLDLTFAQVLALKDQELKTKLLKLLLDSMEPLPEQDEPQPEQDEPQPEPQGDDEDAAMIELANKWRGLDWWDVLGLDLSKLNSLANPKAAIKRAYNKALKQCHSDKFGANEALEILKDALAAANKMFK